MKTAWIVTIVYATLGIGALGGLYAMYFITHQTLTLRDAAQEELRRLSGQDSYTRSLTSLARDTRAEREQLADLFFSSDLLDAIEVIESIGATAGAPATVRSVGEPTQAVGSTLAVVPITIEVRGTFSSVQHVLKLFETAPYAMMISQMRLVETEVEGEWSAVMQLAVGHIDERKQKQASEEQL